MKVTVHDISTNKVITRDATQEEMDQAQADALVAAENQSRIASAITQRSNDLALVKAKGGTDPAFAALARLLGQT